MAYIILGLVILFMIGVVSIIQTALETVKSRKRIQYRQKKIKEDIDDAIKMMQKKGELDNHARHRN